MPYTVIIDPPQRVFADNDVWLKIQHPSPGTAPANYQNVVRVLVETAWGSGTFNPVQDLYSPPLNAAGQSIYNLRDVLRKYVLDKNSAPKVPDITTADTLDTVTHKRYKLSYYEFANGVLTGGGAGDTSAEKQAYIGGLSFNWDAEMSNELNGVGLNAYVLTKRPRTYTTDAKSLDVVSFITMTAMTAVFVQFTFYDANGTSTSYNTPSIVVTTYRKYHLNIGLLYLESIAAFGTMPVRYTWKLRDATVGDLSPLYTVEVVCCSPRNKRFLFMNSVGGYDALLTTGQHTVTVDIDAPVAQRTMQYGVPHHVGSLFQYAAFADEKTKVQSDWQDLCFYRYWQDLMQYKGIKWEFIAAEYCEGCETEMASISDYSLRPILVTDQNVLSNNNTNNELYRVQFDYRYAFDNGNYSPNTL